ncbi:efflux RND transporter periplasmic adaptor subunit [Rhodopirellula sp. P2]|uniref:efflux RND transporter periplasmic adaptor subunit n=1 Tax=Rhodopirellula sp. P2 TaxID=2127060 RepID=UPI0023677392|nr:efflux RND transporter periplasmic adaptor subunit [Rhodopirellula sp. P2]WDQ15303.1 efflux RND transporter periplasmic adaptor subunit [Rhodopirellula sp. P2]
MSQKFLITVLSVSTTTFLLGGLASYWVGNQLSPAADSASEVATATPAAKRGGPQAQLVRVDSIQRKTITPVRTLVGDLIAVRRATIATEVAGKIIELPVDEGSAVIAGKTRLARVDDTWTKLEEDKIATQIAEQKATLEFERADLRRYEDMLKHNAVSLSEAEQKRSLIEGLEAALAQHKVMLREANERDSRLEIFAPFDGSVVAKLAEVGEYLPIGSPIVEIVSSGRIDARIMVPEESLALIRVGDSLDMLIDSLGIELRGEVASINAQGSVGSRTFPVRIAMDDQDGTLLPGMGVSAFIPIQRESTELLVPRDAVLRKPDESTIWILEQGDSAAGDPNAATSGKPEGPKTNGAPNWTAHPIPVRVLSHTRESYAIAPVRKVDRPRLEPGVQVVTEGLERLVPGARVKVDPDTSELAAVPGTYRTGQQKSDRDR